MNEIEKLKARLTELHEISKGIQAKADAERRDLKADEQTELDAVMAEFDAVESDIKRRERILAQEQRLGAPQPRQASPNPVATPEPAQPRAAAPEPQRMGLQNTRLSTVQERSRWGFQSMGDFASSVRNAVLNPAGIDQRLVQNAAASTYGSEGVGADGGFAVPPEWRAEIMSMVDGEDSLLSRTDQQRIAGNSITFPTDESTAWQTTGGIQAYWDSEASTITQSKPALQDLTIKLHRLTALVPMTEELLEDAPAMSGYVTSKAAEKIAFKVNDAIVNGTGSGQPLGLMNAPCKVQVSKISSQVAATIHAKNIVSMWARLPAASQRNAVWLVNQDCLPQIYQLGFAVTDGTSTNVGAGALYMGPGQLANGAPSGTILGRPIVVTEACQTLGTAGDIILCDLSKYLAVVKGAIKTDTSIHLWFDQNLMAFRFVLRMNGQPWLSAAIARKNGSNTLSHVITLETR
ncbi:MAG TPA: phage major capsid protein [Burkholderiaceae bacterium]|nr:phage major capsid protein [Burkholderiaceae bacterium]